MTMNKKYRGILYIIISAFCFALMNLFVRMSGDIPSVQKSFFRNIVAALCACVILVKSGSGFRCRRENMKYMLLRSVFGLTGILCNFYAVDHLVLSDASMLNKMSPFFAVLFSYLILKEKVTLSQALVVAGAFAGSMFVIKPTFSNMDLIPSIIGLLGGISAGAAYTMVRKLGTVGEKGPFIVFFFSAFSSIAILPWLIFDYHPMSMTQIAILLLAGIAAAGGQFAITAAYTHAPAREISVYDYSQILFSAVLGFVVFGQIPDALSWAGYVIICTMAVVMNFNGKNCRTYVKMIRERLKEPFLYIVFGILTTLVNTIVFGVLAGCPAVNYMAANVAAWIVSVAFAFVSNKQYVFGSPSWKRTVWLRECRDFVCARLATGMMDMLLMFVLVSKFQVDKMPAKIFVNILVIIVNYVLSKLWIFRKEAVRGREEK